MTMDGTPKHLAQEQARHWLVKLSSGVATQADAQAFKNWCNSDPHHAQAWREVSRDWQLLQASLASAKEGLPQEFDESLLIAQANAQRTKRRVVLGALATTPLFVALAYYPPLDLWSSLQDFHADFHTAKGEQREIQLAQGLVVQMNTATRLNWSPSTEHGAKLSLLAGEAEISARDNLAIQVAQGRIELQQGILNVRILPSSAVCVACLSGYAELQLAQRHFIAANEQVVYKAQSVQSHQDVDQLKVSAWRSGMLSFIDVPLQQVVDEINRYRSGRLIIRNPQLAQRPVRMTVSIHKTDIALHMLRDLYGAQLSHLPGGIVLLG